MQGAVRYRLRLRDFPVHERPRERMLSSGASSLSDAELLAILIGTGSREQTAVDLARRLLDLAPRSAAGNRALPLRHLVSTPVDELAGVAGIGPAKAARIKAAFELGRRLATGTAARPTISQPADCAALVMESMRDLEQEHFQVILLNVKNQVLGVELVSVGGLSSAPAHPREVFRPAIRRNASAVVLCHNHPSGDPTPSPEDVMLTRRLVAAGELLGIDVLDHVVIGDNRYQSFRERGLL